MRRHDAARLGHDRRLRTGRSDRTNDRAEAAGLRAAFAALPYTVVPSGRAASLLVYRRHDLAAAGLAVLAGVFVLYLLSVA